MRAGNSAGTSKAPKKTSSTPLWIGIGVVLVLGLAGGGYWYWSQHASASASTVSDASPPSAPAAANASATSPAAASATSAATSALSDSGTPPSAKDFVQHFYDWYGPFTNAPGNKENVSAVLKDQQGAFDPTLATALADDADAQSRADGESVGLDHDPFVNAQDTCGRQQRFETGKVLESPTDATVEVYAICDGKREPTPRVLVSLSQRDGKWVFTDFGTPSEPHQLTTALQALKSDRMKPNPPDNTAAQAQSPTEPPPTAQEPAAPQPPAAQTQQQADEQAAQRQARLQARQQAVEQAAQQQAQRQAQQQAAEAAQPAQSGPTKQAEYDRLAHSQCASGFLGKDCRHNIRMQLCAGGINNADDAAFCHR